MLNSILFADDTVLIAENESDLQKLVIVFDTVCKRRKLKVNAGKSKVIVFERAREQTFDFAKPYSGVRGYVYLDVRYGWGRRRWRR